MRKKIENSSLRTKNALFEPFNAFGKMLETFVQRLKLAVATSEKAAPLRIINNYFSDKKIDHVMI